MRECIVVYVCIALGSYGVFRLITKEISKSLFFTYCLVVLLYTVIFRKHTNVGYKLIPLWSYYCIWINWFRRELIIENILNICMMIPFGILACGCNWFANTRRVVIVAFLFESGIELMQLMFSLGLAEWDDIIHGCFGAFIGWKVAMIFYNLKNRELRGGIS